MIHRLTPEGFSVIMSYNDEDACLGITSEGNVAVYDEDECDKLLRVMEYALSPTADLDEFFESEFPRTHWRVAVQFTECADQLSKLVYDD